MTTEDIKANETNSNVDQNVTKEPVYDAEYVAWQKRKAVESRLNEMVEKDPGFKDVLETKLGDKTYRDEILAKPRILEDDDLFTAKTQLYSKELMTQIKKIESEKGQAGVGQTTTTQTKTEDRTERGGARVDVSAASKPENTWRPENLTDDELKKKGYKDRDIVMLRTFG